MKIGNTTIYIYFPNSATLEHLLIKLRIFILILKTNPKRKWLLACVKHMRPRRSIVTSGSSTAVFMCNTARHLCKKTSCLIDL